MGFASRERVERLFTWSRAADSVAGVYHDLIGQRLPTVGRRLAAYPNPRLVETTYGYRPLDD
jgi:hypothetical protein